jgi:hypothetical protein
MCTVVILYRPGHEWPLLLAANRDEMSGRPWDSPARHWPDRPAVRAGRDLLAGGTWMGLNDRGLVAAILNRPGTLGPRAGFASRGELPLMALDRGTAEEAARWLAALDATPYRPFNMVLADREGARWARWDGQGLEVRPVPPGLSMLTAHDLNDSAGSIRMRRYRPLFEAAPVPDPDRGDWKAWRDLLARRDGDDPAHPRGALCVVTEGGFGTVCSSLLGLPAEGPPVWLFAPGRPGEVEWGEVP